jgi:hypothetical protein
MTEEKLLQESDEMDFSRIKTITHDKPFDVFYQTEVASGWNNNGYYFTICNPSLIGLLSRDIWMEYTLDVEETVERAITGMFENNIKLNIFPETPIHQTFRQGNVLARATNSLQVTINNFTFEYKPAYYIDVWNRLHVSNTQSEHEFSGSGGKFDNGNHSLRDGHTVFLDDQPSDGTINTSLYDNEIPDDYRIEDRFEDRTTPDRYNTRVRVHLYNGFLNNIVVSEDDKVQDLICNMRPEYPLLYPYYNEGLGNRFAKFSSIVRFADTTISTANADPGVQFQGDEAGSTTRKVTVTMWERLPLPLFKMYSLDEVEGVIPNIQQLVLRGELVQDLVNTIMRINQEINPKLKIVINSNHYCKLHIKWFIPSFSIPKEVKIEYPSFITKIIPFNGTNLNIREFYVEQPLVINDISFPALPDLLLLYVKCNPFRELASTPDDFNMELLQPSFALNASNSKILNIQSIQAYHLWKQNLKYSLENVIGFDEWRKFCFVLVLKPEDFGIKLKKEYNEPCNINFRCTMRNWHNVPKVWNAPTQTLGEDTLQLVFVAHGVYFRNQLKIRKDKAYEILKTM